MPKTGFKLIAITALEGCNPKYLKILETGKPYYFYNNYKIEVNDDGIEKIIVSEDIVPRIYDIDNMQINISAVVGKNGSGKSSLVELLYVVFFNLSKQLKIVKKKDDEGKIYETEADIRVAMYFSVNETIYKLQQFGWENVLHQFNESNSGYFSSNRMDRQQMEMLFYNIVINYSHYGLNTREVGHWIKSIFHKNDGYQTPIVLNPFRDEGKININVENYLVRSRLLVNILERSAISLWFSNNEKIPTRLHFSIDYDKFTKSKRSNKVIFNRTAQSKRYILPTVYEVFFGDKDFQPEQNLLNNYATEYILNKLFAIAVKYKHYFKYQRFGTRKTSETAYAYFKDLLDDQSHITFKLKQALNFLRFNSLPKDQETFDLPVDEVARGIAAIKRRHDIPTLELVPPSFLAIDIEFSSSEDRFSRLSSGEKQKIYAFASLIYHLKNLESILRNPRKKNKPYEKLIRYRHVNVIFDEIELYYHPDLQRRFINDLISNLRAAKFQLIESINFIFITHSPFVLSDIPQQQTLYLDIINRKSVQRHPYGNTFGGNIHDLLANNFFLEEHGYMGEYAKKQITEVYEYLTYMINFRASSNRNADIRGWSKAEARKLIDMIGEPLIQSSLNQLYADAFLNTRSDIDREIERLQTLRKTKLD